MAEKTLTLREKLACKFCSWSNPEDGECDCQPVIDAPGCQDPLQYADSILSLLSDHIKSKGLLTDCDYSHPKDLYFNIKQVFPDWETFSIWEKERIQKACDAQLSAILKDILPPKP